MSRVRGPWADHPCGDGLGHRSPPSVVTKDVTDDFPPKGNGHPWLVGYREGRGDSPLPTIDNGVWLGHDQLRFLFGRHVVDVFYARINDQMAAERVARQLEELGATVELFAHQALAHSYLDHLSGDTHSFDPYQRTIESAADLSSIERRLERLRRTTSRQFGSVDWVDFNWLLKRKFGLVLAGEAEQVFRKRIDELNRPDAAEGRRPPVSGHGDSDHERSQSGLELDEHCQ